jgi:SAM-dependent methyltransferase
VGCDIDSEAVAWCSKSLTGGKFIATSAMPPLPFADSAFDFLYAISVVTHLPEAMQLAWLKELSRVLRPGGHALISVHGQEHCGAGSPTHKELMQKGFAYAGGGGTTAGLPDFYRQAFHLKPYIDRVWSEFFEIIRLGEREVADYQDLVVCKKRLSAELRKSA